jgi:hypothetical protein
LDNNILEGDEESRYLDNYNPQQRRDIYYRTFQKIKKKAWIKLKENYIRNLPKDPQKLFRYVKNNIGLLPPDEVKITYANATAKRTKWKSQIQQLSRKKNLYFKSIKFKVRDKRNKQFNYMFKTEALVSDMKDFFKYQGSSPYPQKLTIKLFKYYNEQKSHNAKLLKDNLFNQIYKYSGTKPPFISQRKTVVLLDDNAHTQYLTFSSSWICNQFIQSPGKIT